MKIIIVPDYVRDAINVKLDKAIEACPDAAKERDMFYNQLLAIYDQSGSLPDFDLERISK